MTTPNRSLRRGVRLPALLLGAALLAASCTGSDDAADDEFADDEFLDDEFADDEFLDDEFADDEFAEDDFADDEFAEEEFAEDEFTEDEFADDGFADEPEGDVDGEAAEPADDESSDDPPPASSGGGVGPASGVSPDELPAILAELEEAGFCDPVDVENDGTVSAMHFVADGQVQQACYTDEGADDPRLIQAWEIITDIAPTELYDDVSLLAGYEGATDTLAFVTTLDEAASFFLLAVDVTAADNDPDELRLTMLHELTHVFAQHPGEQLDVSIQDAAECDTFFNGSGCFRNGSYIVEWIEEFWTSDMLDQLPEDGAPLGDDESFELCVSQGGGFVGAYAATHPEEDFAETFSAYVFSVDMPADLDPKFAFFDRYPEFAEMRDTAQAQGLTGLEGGATFDLCQ